MDFMGLSNGKFHAFPVSRKLRQEEIDSKIENYCGNDTSAKDLISVIKINNCYMEMVDRWYAHKGEAVFAGFISMMIAGLGFGVMGTTTFLAGDWPFFIFVTLLCAGPAALGWVLFRLEAFQLTHYPVRLNRKNRMVYAILPRGDMVKVKWDNLFVYLAENKIAWFPKPFYEIRAHVLSDDRENVLKTFSLGYPTWGEKELTLGKWEFVRRYMEDSDGYEKNSELIELCMPLDGVKESLSFCIIRGMGPLSGSFLGQLFLSPIYVLGVWGRMVAIYTSKIPRWPEDIEAKCHVSKDDPYAKTADDNAPFTFVEGTWPIICFCIGSLITFLGVVWAAYTYVMMFVNG
ncbi:DUF6708 domain-containing protein [Halomonas sp. BN3-1]|uniref:DUF6708 domain-containing protein n=1 Tax=Halomonas sp. BN3-1 TaxID=2082393 RepID=UPI000D367D2A|nr:DUF6708 domain-containing protein [Halomonas sp. BN3-1]